MRLVIRVFIVSATSLVAVVAVFCGYVLLVTYLERNDCGQEVSQNRAKALIEEHLQKPSASAVLQGKPPIMLEMQEVWHASPYPEREQRRFKFRLIGTQPDEWGYVVIDDCGGMDLTGGFAGK